MAEVFAELGTAQPQLVSICFNRKKCLIKKLVVIKISAKIFRSKKLFSQIESLYKNIFVLRNYLSKKTILLSRKTLKKELGQKKLAG